MTKSWRRVAWSGSRAALCGSALLAALLPGGQAMATGFFGPNEYLARYTSLTDTPEFYWDLEVKRLSASYHPAEKPALAPRNIASDGDTVDTAPMTKATADADAADFAAALKDGEIKPPDPEAATQQHADARAAIDSAGAATPPPAEFASEFADYNRGAYAFRVGKDHWDEARKAWLALLDRPAAERHYRTIWAAFMLGKLALKSGDPGAAKWFEKTREFAAQGFADSLGMAADSYGWEGRGEWKQGHPEKAAPLFLTQLALGDESAVVSLKALIPDREAVDGMLNYGPDPGPAPQTDADKAAAGQKVIPALKAMAADPLLRKLETAHILATAVGGDDEMGDATTARARSTRWLAVVRASGLATMDGAEYLGWVAYTTGDYKDAQHWLDLATGDTPAASWLRARLLLRAGKLPAAAASMAKAWEGIREAATYTRWNEPPGYQGSIFVYDGSDEGDLSMQDWVNGDMGAVHLLRTDFVQALDTFLKGGLRDDAAYVAERVLTADELKAYVDKMPAPPPPDPNPDSNTPDPTTWLRYLLGRRLVREDRYTEAAAYLPPAYAKLLARYAEALKNGADATLPKARRAQALSTAAWLARNDGMELMGTEVSPDGFDFGGDFENPDLAAARISGTYQEETDDNKEVTRRVPYPAAKSEIQRLKKNGIHPDLRFHYRIIAAALAVKAAALMDDNTEELADALNTAGTWVKDRDEKLGDRYYQIIEKRCPKTKIGQEVIAKHWFVNDSGPWITALDAAGAALHKELGIQDPG